MGNLSPDHLELLDWLFHFAHLIVILINVTFWWWRRTLWLAQIMLALTFLSWVAFGPVYGFGYCFLTDWHWQVKEALGQNKLPASYIKYVLDRASGRDLSVFRVDVFTTIVMATSVVGCLVQTYKIKRRRSGAFSNFIASRSD